ncbi:uncharacterized protein LOC144097240 [Amblyomma americanum]
MDASPGTPLPKVSSSDRDVATFHQHSSNEGLLQEDVAPGQDSRRFVLLSEGPFKQGLTASRKSKASLGMISAPSTQAFVPRSTEEFLERPGVPFPLWATTSPRESTEGLSKERGPSPVSCDVPWSLRSVSHLFSQSTYGDEFDRASLSHHVSSIAEERDRHGSSARCPWYFLVAFLAALSIGCVTAVVVDVKWAALSHSIQEELFGHANADRAGRSAEDDVPIQRGFPLARTSAAVKPSAGIRYRSPARVRSAAVGLEDKGDEEADAVMKITRRHKAVKPGREKYGTGTHAAGLLPRHSRSRHHTPAFTAARRERIPKARPTLMAAPIHRPTKHKCGLAFYTYCSKFRHEAYYRHTTRTCVRTITDDVQVCNHSPNRFATRKECEQSCVHSRQPSDVCFDKTLFSWCSRLDVNASWWVFDGKRCRPWPFPHGLCPSPVDSDVFDSLHECKRRCSTRTDASDLHSGEQDDNSDRSASCRGPGTGATCGPDVLRFPYFADMSSGDGRMRCVRASAARLLTQRCLIGSNRFFSEGACKKACVRRRHHEA